MVQLKLNEKKMNKQMGDRLRFTEWEVGERVMYRAFSEEAHVLSPGWMGPVPIVNKANSIMYQLELKTKKGKPVYKWFHITQLKA